MFYSLGLSVCKNISEVLLVFIFTRVYYAHTRSSLTLLESVCRCVQMNEPVLLVGETGVGKTATLDYLSKITGKESLAVWVYIYIRIRMYPSQTIRSVL